MIHVGTNHREKAVEILQKISKLQASTEGKIQDAVVYFSGKLSKFGSAKSINYVNETVFNLCALTNGMYFISHNSFVSNHILNKRLFWKGKIHPNRKG